MEDGGEKNLLLAILERALMDATGELRDVPQRDRVKVQRQARAWVFRNSNGPFSFKWCVAALDLDPGSIRQRIKEGKISWSLPEKAEGEISGIPESAGPWVGNVEFAEED